LNKYYLKCPNCNKHYTDDGKIHTCIVCGNPLLEAIYNEPPFKKNVNNMFDFNWLPVRRQIDCDIKPCIYKCSGLSKYFGINNLYIAFSGYWPEMGAKTETCTFKDFETYAMAARLGDTESILAIPSSGSIARSFVNICEKANIKSLLIVPKDSVYKIWLPRDPSNIKTELVSLGGDFTYNEAIVMSENLTAILTGSHGYFYDGGFKNPARRDGAGIIYLDFIRRFGFMPGFFVQAVGSGNGPLGIYTEQKRLDDFSTRIIMVQNAPLHPVYDYIRNGIIKTQKVMREEWKHTAVKELSNMKPPLTFVNGIAEIIEVTGGNAYCVTNDEVKKGMELFKKYEGIDILDASGVATYSLHALIHEYNIKKTNESILLHISGGGIERMKKDYEIYPIEPKYRLNSKKDVQDFINGINKLQ